MLKPSLSQLIAAQKILIGIWAYCVALVEKNKNEGYD